MYGYDYDECNEVPDGWSACVAHYGHLDNALFPGFEFKDVSTFDNAGLICESINGKKIKSLNNIFTGCSALKNFVDGFAVPAGVTDLYDMFEGCSSLETLPAGVTNIRYMFDRCYKLSGTITINATSAGIDVNYGYCFDDAGIDSSGITVICNDSELTTKLQSTVDAGNVIFTTSTP